jgi:phosphate starvation-inducible protein PhoH
MLACTISGHRHDKREGQDQMLSLLEDVPGASAKDTERSSNAMSALHETAQFDSSSDDNNIRRALQSAKELRRAVLEAVQEKSFSQRRLISHNQETTVIWGVGRLWIGRTIAQNEYDPFARPHRLVSIME